MTPEEPIQQDPRAMLRALPSDRLLAFTRTASKDLEKAAEEQPNSEWHEACFAATALCCEEMARRNLKLLPD